MICPFCGGHSLTAGDIRHNRMCLSCGSTVPPKVYCDCAAVQPKHTNGWIPCADRLPGEGVEVLIHSTVYGYTGVAMLLDGAWTDDDIEYYEATHWQPLPEPPTK